MKRRRRKGVYINWAEMTGRSHAHGSRNGASSSCGVSYRRGTLSAVFGTATIMKTTKPRNRYVVCNAFGDLRASLGRSPVLRHCVHIISPFLGLDFLGLDFLGLRCEHLLPKRYKTTMPGSSQWTSSKTEDKTS
jgi:hypothetical protein